MTPAIEHVARLVCERKGLDPDQPVAGHGGPRDWQATRRIRHDVEDEVYFIQSQLRAWETNQ